MQKQQREELELLAAFRAMPQQEREWSLGLLQARAAAYAKSRPQKLRLVALASTGGDAGNVTSGVQNEVLPRLRAL